MWYGRNKSDRLHNKGPYHKWQYKVTFFRIKILCIQPWKRMATSASLCEGPIFYFYVFTFMQRVKVLLSIPFDFSLLASIMWWGKITYIQLDMGSMSYYCWHHPWGEYVGRLNHKPLSFYVSGWNVSGWNVLLMCMRWVLEIIEDYMMVEYVDLPKGSDTWSFLKRWWIVVAKLTENIVCWFLI